jgi:hypothetical protein
VLALALGAAACGKKLPPLAPLQVIPARPEPLALVQEGTDVVLRFPYPSRTAQGEDLTDLTKVTVWRELQGARPGAKPPAPPEASARAREEKQYLLRAERVAELSRADLDEATLGSDVVVRDSLVPLLAQKRLGRVFLRYGVTATRGAKNVSELSPLTSILPAIPPDVPLHLQADVEERRVCLSWIPPEALLDGTTPAVVLAYAVYRRAPSDEEYGDPIGLSGKVPLYVDETVESGKRYLYTVRASPGTEKPLVLGAPADEVLADTKDVFPPPAPEGVLVLQEMGANRVLWNPVLSSDFAGYRIYRKDPGGDWRLLAEGLRESTFVDKGAPAGAAYAVSAVDKSGNEGPRGEPAPEKR